MRSGYFVIVNKLYPQSTWRSIGYAYEYSLIPVTRSEYEESRCVAIQYADEYDVPLYGVSYLVNVNSCSRRCASNLTDVAVSAGGE